MADVVNSVVINYKSVGLEKVGADLKGASAAIDGLVVSSATAFKATTALEDKFKGLQKSTSVAATAISEMRGAALGLAAGIGPVGAVLGSFGPWGVAAAAGIGLVTNAFTYLSESAGKMGDEAVKLKQFSDVSGLTTTQVRGLSEAGQELGVGAEAIAGGIEKFTVGLSEARKGSGDLYEQLKQIDKQLAIQIASTRSSSEALDLLAKAYNSTTDATTKAALSRAAFGRGGVGVGPVLGVFGAEGVEAYSQAASKALGVTEDWTKAVASLRNQAKDLRGDIETIKGGLFAKEALEHEVALLKAEYEIIKATRAAIQQGGQPIFGDIEGAGGAIPLRVSQGAMSGEAGRGGMIRDTEAHTRAIEENERAINADKIAIKEMATASQNMVSALGFAATAAEKETARVEALTVAFNEGKISAETYGRALNANPILNGVKQTTEEMVKQNELSKATSVSDEKRIASQQAYEKVVKQLGDTEAGRAAAHERSDAVAESYRINMQKAAESTKDLEPAWSKMMKLMPNINGEFSKAAMSAGSLGRFLAIAFNETAKIAAETDMIADNTARASKTAADFARAMQLGSFAPNVMPVGPHEFAAQGSISYSGGSAIHRIGPSGPSVLLSQNVSETQQLLAATQSAIDANNPLKNSIDDLKDSTDKLNATNQELLSPFYTQDPRTSHIGFRSQGMAAGGYVDVPGSPSANDNMIAQIPVASGERIYVDPMASRRGGGGVVNQYFNSPMMFAGNVDRDEVGRTVYQNSQRMARQVAAASR